MKSIEVAVLNPEVIPSAEKMMVCAARLTQRGHKIKSLDDFMALYNKSYTEDTVTTMTKLPHPTIQKFGAINVVIVGASRRFLAQITRHQNEVKFMSASLQYSDYSDDAAFAIPYEVMERGEEETYLTSCKLNMANYAEAVRYGLDNDAAGYMAPQGLRNVLIISATPYQWKHIIGQRTCRRNTSETRLVLLKVWDELYKLNPLLFSRATTGPFCMRGACKEGKMGCKNPMPYLTPSELLRLDYPLLFREEGATDAGYPWRMCTDRTTILTIVYATTDCRTSWTLGWWKSLYGIRSSPAVLNPTPQVGA